MFETVMAGGGNRRGALSFSSSLLLQCGVVSGLFVAGMMMPIAQPELAELRIPPSAPRLREAIKILSTSIERSAPALVKPRPFVYVPPTNHRLELVDSRSSMEAMVAALPPVTGGQVGVPDGIVGSPELPRAAAPPAIVLSEIAKPAQAVRVQVGGSVLASKMLLRVQPLYPELARRMRIEGVVQLHGIITREGRIAQLRVLSGHSLLVQAALDAVRQWVYSPTLLNQQAVEVEAPIEVRFTLSR